MEGEENEKEEKERKEKRKRTKEKLMDLYNQKLETIKFFLAISPE